MSEHPNPRGVFPVPDSGGDIISRKSPPTPQKTAIPKGHLGGQEIAPSAAEIHAWTEREWRALVATMSPGQLAIIHHRPTEAQLAVQRAVAVVSRS